MKKLLHCVLLILTATFTATAYNFSSVYNDKTIYFNITSSTEKTVSVTYKNGYNYNSYSGDIIIPESVTYNSKTYTVTSIGNCAFYRCSSLTSVIIPESVTEIGNYAFEGCTSLTSFNGKYASDDHRCLIVDGTLKAFAPYGLSSYIIPDSVTSIGDSAFSGYSGLTSVTIPNSVTEIGYSAFWYCSSLTSVTIPDSVTSIDSSAFYGTALLNDKANWVNNVLYIGNHIIRAKSTISGEYKIKDGTITIAGDAFRGCSGLTSVIIPNSIIS